MAFLAIRVAPDKLLPFDLPHPLYPEFEWSKPLDLHLTLRFYPKGAPVEIALLRDKLDQFVSPVSAFDLDFEGAGLFTKGERGGVLWLRPQPIPEALTQLQSALEEWTSALGFPPDPKVYAPHVTIARYPAKREVDAFSLAKELENWKAPTLRVQEIALMKRGQKGKLNETDPIYETLATYSLKE